MPMWHGFSTRANCFGIPKADSSAKRPHPRIGAEDAAVVAAGEEDSAVAEAVADTAAACGRQGSQRGPLVRRRVVRLDVIERHASRPFAAFDINSAIERERRVGDVG